VFDYFSHSLYHVHCQVVLGPIDTEDGGTTILRNRGIY